jgi:glyoxylase-like metal-dependent hydrolase (beta-lactamase superfamily II)
MRVRQTIAGYGVLDLAVKDVQVNPPLALAVPDAARNVAERVTSEKVAEGVWFLAGGSHNSVLIELQDQLVLVETPLNDARTRAVIEHAKGLVPGKPIRTAVNSHQHFDHSGGVRAAVAEGATIVTHADNAAYFEKAFGQANRVLPDALARSGKKPVFRTFADKLEIGDASRPIEVHRIVGGPHSESIALIYLPKEKLLIEADVFTPPAQHAAAGGGQCQRANLVTTRAAEAVGRSHPAAARPGRAGRRPVRGDAANATALTLSRGGARSRKSCSRSA